MQPASASGIQPEHLAFHATLSIGQFCVAALGLAIVLMSSKREYSKDVQILRWIAMTFPALTAGAMAEFYKPWFPFAAAWAVLEFAVLLLLVRPLNIWAVIRQKGDPGDPPNVA